VKKIILFLFLAAPAFADELAVVGAQIERVKKQDSAISGRIADSDKIVFQTKKELVKTAGEISRLEYEKADVEGKIKILAKKQGELARKISETNARLSDSSAALVAIGATGAPPGGGNDYMLSMSLLSAISEQFDRDMEVAVAQVREYGRLQKKLEKEHGVFASAQQKYKKERQELDALLRVRAMQNHKLRGRQYELRKKLGDLSAKAKNLTELADKIAPPPPMYGESRFSGKKTGFPAGGMLILRFGEYGASGLKSDGWRVRTRANAIVAAPADGKIEFADYFRGYRRIAIINHDNGYYSVLTGMEELNVLVGQEVLAGEPIGRMPEKNPEIYLELRRGTKAVDPAAMFIEPR
jgi:septal ring factor EnvC (AmiA/AmiB activator)